MIGKDVSMTKNKLNILFLLNEIQEPISELNIAQAMIENNFMEYFSFKKYLGELEQSNFIQVQEILDQTYYILSERGKSTLEYFENIMMGSEKKLILKYIQENRSNLTKYRELHIDHKKISDQRYLVEVKLLENESAFFSLDVEVPSKGMMERIIDNWNSNSTDLYLDIMGLLIGNNKEDE